MQPEASASERPAEGVGQLVARNTLYLSVSQVLTIPLAIVVNAALARYLGSAEFGVLYLAGTIAGFGFLAVNWGHEGALPALVAQNHEDAGALLGTSLAWRGTMSLLVYLILALGCRALHYSAEVQWALFLTCIGSLLTAFTTAYKDTIRGFERMDIPAYAHVIQQFLALSAVPVMILGGRMRTVLTTWNVCVLIVLGLLSRMLKKVTLNRLSVDRKALKSLFSVGTPFIFYGIAMALQPSIDAMYLSKLAPLETMGWFAVSRRLIGVLVFPASSLIGALYPTLCRLALEGQSDFNRVARGALQGTALLVVPAALGCGLYPEIGIAIFNRKSFGPAEDNLRILSVFLFLMYFSMPLGSCIMAAGKQRAWSIVQSICIVVSLIADPLLVPWFQRRAGNGGLGLCVAALISEVFVVGCGLALLPKGILDRQLARSLSLALLSGGVMILVAMVCRPLSPFIGAPLATLAYGVALWLTGALEKSQTERIKAFIGRKLTRAR